MFEGLRRLQMEIGGQPVMLEIAASPSKRQVGLMHRTGLPKNHGMLFSFPNEGSKIFTMKNCKMDMDIVSMDRNGTVFDISHMFHPRTKSMNTEHFIDGPLKFAIEFPFGTADSLGIKLGDMLPIRKEIEIITI